jgi:predicted nucleic acid-binding protein
MDRLTGGERSLALKGYADLVTSFTMLEVSSENFVDAARIIDFHEAGVRAGDALHLAVASANALTLATLDKKLAKAAAGLGYAVELVT